MSLRALVWAFGQIRDGRVSKDSAKLILLKLADRANDDGTCWPGRESLGLDVGISEITARAATKILEDAQLIQIERRKDAGGRDLSNLYHLLMAEGEGSNFYPRGSNPYPQGKNPDPRSSRIYPESSTVISMSSDRAGFLDRLRDLGVEAEVIKKSGGGEQGIRFRMAEEGARWWKGSGLGKAYSLRSLDHRLAGDIDQLVAAQRFADRKRKSAGVLEKLAREQQSGKEIVRWGNGYVAAIASENEIRWRTSTG